MFKSKQKIRELTNQVERKDREIKELTKKLEDANDRLKAFQADEDGTPSDCKRGRWCQSCEFRKAMFVPEVGWGYGTVYFCGKGESCKNFVQKEA